MEKGGAKAIMGSKRLIGGRGILLLTLRASS